MAEKLWDVFKTTGSVEDYLKYSAAVQAEENKESDNNEKAE